MASSTTAFHAAGQPANRSRSSSEATVEPCQLTRREGFVRASDSKLKSVLLELLKAGWVGPFRRRSLVPAVNLEVR